MNKELIEKIRKKYSHYGDTEKLNKNTAVLDIRLLLEELDKIDRV
jgi:hypothetical protein